MKNLYQSLSFAFIILFFFSCKKENLNTIENDPLLDDYGQCTDECIDHEHNLNGKIFEKDGEIWLWGGLNEDWNFNITNHNFDLSRLKFGLGRETFEALTEPKYESISKVRNNFFKDDDEFIAVRYSGGVKAYPFDLMIAHEVINDELDGEPIFVAYCVLADFPAVYSRKHCNQVFTFAVSGYTYSKPGVRDDRNAFVLWDRDTESLWWPLINQGISGEMIGQSFNQNIGTLTWERTTWEDLQKLDVPTEVLKYHQTMEPPLNYPRVKAEDICN